MFLTPLKRVLLIIVSICDTLIEQSCEATRLNNYRITKHNAFKIIVSHKVLKLRR